LADGDQIALKGKLQELKEGMNRINHEVHERLSELEEASSSKGKLEQEMKELSRILSESQENLRLLNKGVGYKHEDAATMLIKLQSVQDQLSDVQLLMTQVQQSCDQMKALGQTGPSEELQTLQTLHQDLKDSANNMRNKLDQAIHLREVYYTHKGELESCLSQCEQQMEAVNVIGVTVPTRIDRYKVRYGRSLSSLFKY
jgi:chromosome segregation ATPase